MADEGLERIQIQLGWLSGQDSQAFEQMKNAITESAKLMSAFNAQDFVDAANKIKELSDTIKANMESVRDTEFHERGGPASSGGALGWLGRQFGRGPQEAQADQQAQRAVNVAARTQQDAEEKQAKDAKEEKKKDNRTAEQKQNDAVLKERQEAARFQLDRADISPEVAQASARRVSHGLPAVGSAKEAEDKAAGKDWYNDVDPLAGKREPSLLEIPRFGSLNIQDYLNLLRDKAIQGGLTGERTKPFGKLLPGLSPEGAERYAPWLQKGAKYAGGYYAGRHALGYVGNWFEGQGVTPFQSTAAAAELGYDPSGSQWGLGPLPGITVPFHSPAAAEAWRQTKDRQTLRAMEGINNEQAGEILATTNQEGFGGQLGHNVRHNILAPWVQRGGRADVAAPFIGQAIRTGTMNTMELGKAMLKLADSARAANLGITQTAQSFSAVVEATKQSGGDIRGGMETAGRFQTGFGLNAEVFNQVAESPLYQGLTAGAYGVPPQLQGALSPAARLEMIEKTMKFVAPLGRGMLKPPPTIIHGANGEVLKVENKPKDMEDAFVAQRMGLDVQQYRAMKQRLGSEKAYQSYTEFSEQYQSGLDSMKGTLRSKDAVPILNHLRTAGLRTTQYKFDEKTGQIVKRQGGVGDWNVDEHATKQLDRKAMYDAEQALSHGSKDDGVSQRSEVIDQAKAISKDASYRKKLKEAGTDMGKVGKVVHGEMEKINQKEAEANADYKIVFTGQAQAFFKALMTGDKNKIRDAAKGVTVGAIENQNPKGTSSTDSAAVALGRAAAASDPGVGP
jgi:hypothetical protein